MNLWSSSSFMLLLSRVHVFPKSESLQSQAHNANSPSHSRRKGLSDVVRNDCSINLHLSRLPIAKFSILYDISLVRD